MYFNVILHFAIVQRSENRSVWIIKDADSRLLVHFLPVWSLVQDWFAKITPSLSEECKQNFRESGWLDSLLWIVKRQDGF